MNDDRTTGAGARRTAKRTAKDSIFHNLFKDPEYLLLLYRALHPEDKTTTIDDIELVTIKNVFLNKMYNDLGFFVGRARLTLMILLEVQSTWNINIIVRILLYLAFTLNEFIAAHKLNIYTGKKLPLPKIELYVIYTGERKDRPEWLSLANEYFGGDDTFLDVKVKVIYDGAHGDIINQYVSFTKIYDAQIKMYGRTEKAVLETIRICKDKDVLKDYLETRQKEVVSIMTTLFDEDYIMDRFAEEYIEQGREQGIEQGIEQGREESTKKTALRMKLKGVPSQQIADFLDIGTDKVDQWIAENPSAAHTLPQ